MNNTVKPVPLWEDPSEYNPFKHIYNNWMCDHFYCLIKKVRDRKYKIIVANGVFDILHPGHVNLLRYVDENIDELNFVLVALNSDDSARQLKGYNRPYMNFQDRATMIISLRLVDAVVGFNTLTPEGLFKVIKPDLLLKGEEYKDTDIPGKQYCKEVVYVPELSEWHTSKLVNKIRGTCVS